MIMDNVFLEDWELIKAGPTPLFRPTSLDNVGMGFALSRKVSELSKSYNVSQASFPAWLHRLDEQVSAIFLHGPEILSNDNNPLTALLVVDGLVNPDEWGTGLPFVLAGATTWNKLFRDLTQPQARILRSFLSSELCVMLKREEDKGKVENSTDAANTILEKHPLVDLAQMIVFDVKYKLTSKEKISDELNEDGTREIVREKQFERIAKTAMKKRRIIKKVQKPLVQKVKRAFIASS
jgi:hypothetical protein